MDEIRLTQSEFLTYVALFHVAVGFMLGLIPLIAGIIKNKVRTGVIGLVVATLAGTLLGFLGSIPAMAIFTWLILREQVVATAPVETPLEPDSQETKEN